MKKKKYTPIWVSIEVHHRVKSLAAMKGRKINDFMSDVFNDEQEKPRGGWRGIF